MTNFELIEFLAAFPGDLENSDYFEPDPYTIFQEDEMTNFYTDYPFNSKYFPSHYSQVRPRHDDVQDTTLDFATVLHPMIETNTSEGSQRSPEPFSK
jgi:hypothetical protein